MFRIAMLGVAQREAPRLRRLLPIEAEILLDSDTRRTRTAPLAVDAAVAFSFTPSDAAGLKCRLLQCSAIGFDGIDLASLPQDVTVCNAGEHEAPVAEYVLAAILNHEIGLTSAAAGFDSSDWRKNNRPYHGEVLGKNIGIVGFGGIGKAVATRARAFGMQVVAISRSGRPSPEADEVRDISGLDWLLSGSDYVVLACPLTDETRGLLGAPELARMKPTAILVNVARGPLVSEEALYDALFHKRIAAAVLDTWYGYPTSEDREAKPSLYPFEKLSNVYATPHIAAWTEALLERRYRLIAENLTRFAHGDSLRNVVWRNGAAVH